MKSSTLAGLVLSSVVLVACVHYPQVRFNDLKSPSVCRLVKREVSGGDVDFRFACGNMTVNGRGFLLNSDFGRCVSGDWYVEMKRGEPFDSPPLSDKPIVNLGVTEINEHRMCLSHVELRELIGGPMPYDRSYVDPAQNPPGIYPRPLNPLPPTIDEASSMP